jgi:hypothetical protein
MSTQSNYRRLAENCLRVAAECPDPALAGALRILAADYLSSADAIERPRGTATTADSAKGTGGDQPISRRRQLAPQPRDPCLTMSVADLH